MEIQLRGEDKLVCIAKGKTLYCWKYEVFIHNI